MADVTPAAWVLEFPPADHAAGQRHGHEHGRMHMSQPTTDQLKAAWRRGQLAQRGIAYDEAMSIPYLRAALISTVRAMGGASG